MTTPPIRPHGVPSEYARLEALAASASDGATASAPPASRAEPLVIVAEADPDLRDWVMRGLAEDGTSNAPAFRVEAVATAECLDACLRRETAAVVLCGHLAPPADWGSLLSRHKAGPTAWCVLVEPTGGTPADALRDPGQTIRLAEAIARLLDRTPGPSRAPPASSRFTKPFSVSLTTPLL